MLGGMLTDLRTKAANCCALGLGRERVLDVCCGPGGLRPYLQQRGLVVTGVDRDRHMLGEAQRRERAHDVHLSFPLWALADARQLPFANGSFDVAVVCLALHAMPWEVATAVLAQMRRVAQRVVVADYCLPERNLALPGFGLAFAVERLVGGEHYRCYREFLRRGGLEGFLYDQNITIVRREYTLAGAGMVVLCQS